MTPEHQHNAQRLEIDIVVAHPAGQEDLSCTLAADATGSDLAKLIEQRSGHRPRSLWLARNGTRIEPDTVLTTVELMSGDIVEVNRNDPQTIGSASELRLRFTAGDLSGRTMSIPNEVTLGRSDADGVLGIGGKQTSRRHATIRATATGAEIEDLASTNGTSVNGSRIHHPTPLQMSDAIAIGESRAVIEFAALPPRDLTGAHLAYRTGSVEYRRPPRVMRPKPPSAYRLDTPPATPPKRKFPVAAAVIPLVMGGVMALVFNPMFAIFMAMSPVLVVFTFLDDKRSGRREFAEASTQWKAGIEEARGDIDAHLAEIASWRRASAPTTTELLRWTQTGSASIWSRRPGDPDFLTVALGDGDVPSLLDIEVPTSGDTDLLATAVEVADTSKLDRNVPTTVDLTSRNIVGICGDVRTAPNIARSMVAQAAVLRSPRDLRIAIIAPDHQRDWEWAKWLPHLRLDESSGGRLVAHNNPEAAELFEYVQRVAARRIEEADKHLSAGRTDGPTYLLVIHPPVALSPRALDQLLAQAAVAGIAVIYVAPERNDLPGATAIIVTASSDGTIDVVEAATGISHRGLAGRGIETLQATVLARNIAPIVDVTAGSESAEIPDRVALADVVTGEITPESISQRWNDCDGGLDAIVGIGAGKPITIDLRTDGPHGIVAGTTGSGKSEFLQSMVVSLALNHAPERLNFILIDYKGGAAFRECVNLPHTVGFVTNLDDRLADRALTSLRAELRRRETLFAEHGAKDLETMETEAPGAAPPALLIIIDEFAALKTEVPDFVDGLVDIAQRGRSMGVHMLLATQKPGGVITGQIEANTNLRVALRVANETESNDVIGTRAAADIANRTPGRALLKVGARTSDIVELQSTYVGGRSLSETTAQANLAHTLRYGAGSGEVDLHEQVDDSAPLDIEIAVEAARLAWDQRDADPLHRPWLPTLPTEIGVVDLVGAHEGADPLRVPIGLADYPERQVQEAFELDLGFHGNVAVFGTAGSGKTTFLRTLAAVLAAKNPANVLELHAIDFGSGGLKSLLDLPNCASVVLGNDLERVLFLVSYLRRTVAERRNAMAEHAYSSCAEWRRLDPATGPPSTVVLIDGFGSMWNTFEEMGVGKQLDELVQLLSDGRSVGVHFVLTGDQRSAIPPSCTGAIGLRIIQRLASVDDYSYFGFRHAPSDENLMAGRTMTLDGVDIQIAVLSDDGASDGAAQARVMASLGANLRTRNGEQVARPLPVLQDHIEETTLEPVESAYAVAVGHDVFGDAMHLDFTKQSAILIAGRSGSGRTTALEMLAHRLAPITPDRRLIPMRPGSYGQAADCWTTIAADPEETIATLIEDVQRRCVEGWVAPIYVAIDDAEELFDGPLSGAMEVLVRNARDAGVICAISATTFNLSQSYSLWVRALRNCGTGVLLQPLGADDPGVFGQTFPRGLIATFPPGRGFVLANGEMRVVQLATPAPVTTVAASR